jgi:uncharacterized membrane protein (UPF0127 family)
MRIINTRNGSEIASSLKITKNFFQRMKGLIGRDSIKEGEALFIKPCKSIHTFGMKFKIDAIFLDKENKVIALKKDLKPNRLSPIYLKASSVIELPSGTIDKAEIKIEDKLKFID